MISWAVNSSKLIPNSLYSFCFIIFLDFAIVCLASYSLSSSESFLFDSICARLSFTSRINACELSWDYESSTDSS